MILNPRIQEGEYYILPNLFKIFGESFKVNPCVVNTESNVICRFDNYHSSHFSKNIMTLISDDIPKDYNELYYDMRRLFWRHRTEKPHVLSLTKRNGLFVYNIQTKNIEYVLIGQKLNEIFKNTESGKSKMVVKIKNKTLYDNFQIKDFSDSYIEKGHFKDVFNTESNFKNFLIEKNILQQTYDELKKHSIIYNISILNDYLVHLRDERNCKKSKEILNEPYFLRYLRDEKLKKIFK